MNFDDLRLLTFDCYGTLVDWETGILTALAAPLARAGSQHRGEEVLRVFGEIEQEEERPPFKPYRDVLRNVLRRMSQRLEFPLDPNEENLLAETLPEWPLFPDTNQALSALSGRYALAVLSNVDDDLFAGTRRHIAAELRHVITAEQVGAYKPASAHFDRILAVSGLDRSAILHCGQSAFHDIAPARRLGFRCVRVLRRGHGATIPVEVEADLTVSSMAELAELAL